jgi:putative ABC transport system permease protein
MKRGLSIREPAAIAFETMRTHKLRSFLMLLGIILSVSTLILVVALINGTNKYIADRVANMGSDVFLVSQFGVINDAQEFVKAQRRNRKVNWDDYEYVRDNMKLPKNVGLEGRIRGKVRYESQLLEDISIRGVTANIGEMDVEEPQTGRYISDTDNDHRANTALIGADIAKKMFPTVDPMGRIINVDGQEYTIVGVAKPIGTVMGQVQDEFVYIPIQTFMKVYGAQSRSFNINIQARGPEWMERTKDEARMLMRARRHLAPNEEDSFGVFGSDTIMGLWNNLTGTLAGAMVGIVSVFLLIGAIVIMNVMLAAVTERTREIGIRKSLGARKKDILMQFLVETSVMSTIGGAIGITVAWLLAVIIEASTPVPMAVPISAVIVALSVSSFVGLCSGVYPATRAARLDPIEALRYEM